MADKSSGDAFVEFERVQKSYDGETLVVKDLNLSMPKGEFLTMLGPSGSGKTTCLMMLAGFETATHGDIKLAGRAINNIPPHKRGIGMVFQNYALFPHMTVAENLAFPLQVRKMDKATIGQKVQRALDLCLALGLAHLAHIQRKRQVLGTGHVREQRIVLEHHADPALVRWDVVDWPSVEKDLAVRRGLEPREHHQTGGFSRSRRAEHRKKLALWHAEVQVFDDEILAVIALLDTLEFYECGLFIWLSQSFYPVVERLLVCVPTFWYPASGELTAESPVNATVSVVSANMTGETTGKTTRSDVVKGHGCGRRRRVRGS